MITTLNTAMRTSVYRFVARLALLLTLVVGTLGTASAQTVTYFHNDIAGTPMLATDAAGAVVWKENYLPYGYRQVADPASSGNKLWFTGKAYDPETQLSYMGARYYMPLLGRFTGIDPVEIVPEQPHSFNRYAYANNNPYKFVDPDGEYARAVIKLGITAIAIVGATTYLTPERKAQMEQAGALLKQRTSELLDRASNLIFNEGIDNSSNTPDPASGSEPARGELTQAGRAQQKHGDRVGSAFDPAKGTPKDKNAQGQRTLDGIVNSPDRVDGPNRHGGIDVRESQGGRGARFGPDGKFTGFLEP